MKRLIFILSLSVGTALGIIISLEQSATAQLDSSQPGGEYQSNEQDSNSSSFGNSFNPLDLIHNSNLRRSRDAQQFDEDSQNNLNQAAEEFKRKQQERLQNQSNPNPSPSP